MRTFEKETSSEELFDLIDIWERPIYSFYIGIDKQKAKLAHDISRALPEKRLELLYTELNRINIKLKHLSLPPIKPDESDEYYDDEHEDWFVFERKLYFQYQLGNNPPISFFKEEIKNNYSHTVNELRHENALGNEVELKYGVELYLASKTILYSVLFSINNNTIAVIEMKKEIEKLLEESQKLDSKPSGQKFVWKGKPAHLAMIIDLLIEKGYLEATPYGERTAKILLDFITIQGFKNDVEGLGKLLHKDKYPIKDKTAIDKFNKIPERRELK